MDFSNYQAQETLFVAQPSKLSLLGLEQDAIYSRKVIVNVWRNQAIEPILSLARAYQAYGRYSVEYRIGDYDDTLSFNGHRPADIELLWIDSGSHLVNMAFGEWLEWLAERVESMRNVCNSPIVVATWLQDNDERSVVRLEATLEAVPAVYFANIREVCDEVGVKLLDPRTAAMAGTPISNPAQSLLARKLACHWIPAAVFPPIKAVALDLDNTLHAGILGEDGILGVQLTAGHNSLQHSLKSMRQRGIFLALVSRNEQADVKLLFDERNDYPLRWEDFSAIEVSWGDKGSALERIAKALRIAPDAILFVDDNPGELASAVARLPGIHAVYATSDAMQTQRVIEYYPGLWRWKVEADDEKRVQDMDANMQRDAILKEAGGKSDYFESLQTKLIFRYDPVDQIGRIADLSNKTNQFNLAIRRFNPAQIAEYMSSPKACVATVQMNDRLSDSGVIAMIVAERRDNWLVIEELCISCRAMGRQLEDTLILEAIRGMALLEGSDGIIFNAQFGPRNQPAFEWLSRLTNNGILVEEGKHPLPIKTLMDFTPPDGIQLTKE